MYKLVIFDLDGTLLDTLLDLALACNHALAYYKYPQHPVENYKTYVGDGVYKLIERALPEERREEATILQVKEVFDQYYREHSLDHTQPYEGIAALLKRLQDTGRICCVASNKPHCYTEELVQLMFKEKIHLAYGQREGVPTKPHPQVIWDIMRHFNQERSTCIYIGDSNVDMYTAQKAGIPSVGVTWGFRTEEELQRAGAHFIAHTVEELEALILNDSQDSMLK